MDPLRFKLSTRETQALFNATSDLPRETGPSIPSIGRYLGPTAGLDVLEKRKNSCSSGESNQVPSVLQPRA